MTACRTLPQNRIESYHTLRGAIAKVGSRKTLLGRTDLEVEISNQCARLIAAAIIHYNASIHSHFLEKGLSKKQLKVLKKYSPVAWRHLHFTLHFTFYSNKINIDINKPIENVDIEKYLYFFVLSILLGKKEALGLELLKRAR